MRNRFPALVCAAALVLSACGQGRDAIEVETQAAAGTVVATWSFAVPPNAMNRLDLDLTSDGSGNVEATVLHAGYGAGRYLSGELLRVVVVPDTGATSPTNNWDLYLYDLAWQDVLQGVFANNTNTTATANDYGTTPSALVGAYTVRGEGFGAANGATAYLYYR